MGGRIGSIAIDDKPEWNIIVHAKVLVSITPNNA
jgi:hypothetical protein